MDEVRNDGLLFVAVGNLSIFPILNGEAELPYLKTLYGVLCPVLPLSYYVWSNCCPLH